MMVPILFHTYITTTPIPSFCLLFTARTPILTPPAIWDPPGRGGEAVASILGPGKSRTTENSMSGRPKRTLKPVQRWEPEEIPLDDDDYTDELIDADEARKRMRGEFDGFDSEEMESSGPNEYEVGDGFLVPDDEVDEPSASDGDYEDTDDYDETTEPSMEYDDDEEEYPEKIYEPDVVHRQ